MENAAVNVIGALPDAGMGGLKESLGRFRKHHQEVGDALLNLSGVGTATGEPVDKDEPRPAFEHQEYPRRVYHASGDEKDVKDDVELKAALKSGFRKEPYLKPQVAVGTPEQEKKALLDRNRELEAKINQQNDLLTKALDRLSALEGKA